MSASLEELLDDTDIPEFIEAHITEVYELFETGSVEITTLGGKYLFVLKVNGVEHDRNEKDNY